jgi:hypothetical protein
MDCFAALAMTELARMTESCGSSTSVSRGAAAIAKPNPVTLLRIEARRVAGSGNRSAHFS